MTREEALKIWLPVIKMGVESMQECSEALDMAIKALEQEPCEDAISRQAVLEQINCWIGSGEYRYTNATYYLTERVKNILSVNPQEPKTDMLAKIRERIELEKLGYPPSAGYYKAIMKCLQIIDKYKAESEK